MKTLRRTVLMFVAVALLMLLPVLAAPAAAAPAWPVDGPQLTVKVATPEPATGAGDKLRRRRQADAGRPGGHHRTQRGQ